MNVTVNGKVMELADGASIYGLLETLGLSQRRVAVEHNRMVLPADRFAETILKDGDELEVLSFVGGG